MAESVARGLGYTALLIFGGSALVASFSSYESYPYWPAIPHLRTDTSGVLAFAVALVSLAVSRYLELRRRDDRGATPVKPVARAAGVHAVQGLAEAAAVCATGLVIYLSLNAVVHPWTLRAPADPPVAVAERGHGPGDRARRLLGRRRHQALLASHRDPAGRRDAAPADAAPAAGNSLQETEHAGA